MVQNGTCKVCMDCGTTTGCLVTAAGADAMFQGAFGKFVSEGALVQERVNDSCHINPFCPDR